MMSKTMQKHYNVLRQRIHQAVEDSSLYRIKIPKYLQNRGSNVTPEVLRALIVVESHNSVFDACVRDNAGMRRFLQENP